MKRIIFLFMLLCFVFTAQSQLNYTFTSSSATYAPLSSGYSTSFTNSSNDAVSSAVIIGFTFNFNCVPYTTFQMSTEGWIGLGSGHTGGSAAYTNNLSGTVARPKIAPLWDDLRCTSTGRVRYQLTGTAPNRVRTIDWVGMRWNENSSSTTPVITFQVKLYEGTDVIEFNYLQGATGVNTGSGGASIGLAGINSGEFLSVNSAGTAISSVTETSNITAKPANNGRYTFTPSGASCSGTPAAGTLSASTTTTTCSSSAVNFTVAPASSICGIVYQWQYSSDDITFTDLPSTNSSDLLTDVLITGYYRRQTICTNSGLSANSNSIFITFSGTAAANDIPCNSFNLSIGAPSSGTNICSSDSYEPATVSCWTGGTKNTVWYDFVAPASGEVRIKTIITASANVLQRTQIALFSGTCGNLTQLSCNQDAPDCGGYGPENSEIYYPSLTPGATYYIAVDGESSTVGDFGILVIDGTGSFPFVQGQDCPTSFTVCNPTTTIGNPGYQAIGGQCDHDGSGNCTNGEANSIWYVINVDPALVGSSVLEFDIIPNDYGNPNPITGVANPGYSSTGDETDYDFVLYKVSGTGATSCAGIQSGASDAACNFSSLGVTGATSTGNAPAAYPGFNGAYDVGPTVVAGEQYVIVIQNYSNSTSGFTLDFPVTSPVIFTPPSTVYWSGGAFDNNWNDDDNWGGCNSPACGRSAVVTASSVNQPILVSGNYNVDNLTINPGASLTIQSGATLRLCGDFTNNGSLICQPGSTVLFRQGATQNVTGAFENADSFYNLTIGKNGGSVILNNNIDVDGDFTTNNNNSILNSNGVHVTVGGDFDNVNGNSTYTNTGTTGVLEFSGTTAATYDEGNSQLDLNQVIMEKSGADLTLNTDMFIKSATGSLTMTDGKIITGGDRIDVANGAPAAVNAGNANSYVVGNLYRTLSGSAGSFEFPLGTSVNYERANVTFTTATTIPRLLTRFDPWSGAPNTIGSVECWGNYILPAQDMGLWTINASANPTSGTYDMTLYSTGATNTAGATGWTVQKAGSTAGPWSLNGTCAFSTVSVIARTSMNGFSVFGVAQSTTPLPIELIDFAGYRIKESNILTWTTASELNSDYFLVEKSRNGFDFTTMEKVNAQGNSTSPIDYNATDDEPFSGITYYRLNFFDKDGTNEFSKTIAISSEVDNELTVNSIFPNPGKETLNMDYSVSHKTDLTLSLIDASGRVLKTKSITVNGNGTFTMKTNEVKAGIYMFVVTDNDGFKEVHSWVKK